MTNLLSLTLLIINVLSNDTFENLRNWCNDIYIHPNITMRKSIYGRGIFSTNDIDERLILVSIPINCCLFEANCKHHPITASSLSPLNISMNKIDSLFKSGYTDMSLTLYLVGLQLLKISSPFQESPHYFSLYLDELLGNGAPNIPIFWISELINLIKQNEYYRRSLNQYNHISKFIDSLNLNLNINNHRNKILILFSMVASRVWSVSITNPFIKKENIHLNDYQTLFGSISILIPGAQLFNHHPINDCVKLIYNKTTESINIVTFKKIYNGHEIFINYGKKKSNSILLSQYGFIIENNPYLSTEFDLYITKSDHNFKEKQALLNGLGFVKLRFHLNGLDASSAKAFYIAALSPNHFDSHILGQILSVEKPKDDNGIDEIDEIHRISNKLQTIKSLNSMEPVLRESLCDRCSLLLFQIDNNMNQALNRYKELQCKELANTTVNENKNDKQTFCQTLDMICKYLKLQVELFNSCTKLYCI